MIEFPFRSVGTLKRNRSGPLFQAVADPWLCRSARRLTERHNHGSSNQKYRKKVTPPTIALAIMSTYEISESRANEIRDELTKRREELKT